MAAAFDVAYEPQLVEAAVLAAIRAHAEERAFLRARDRVFEIEDGEAREAAFAALHAEWFERLALDAPFRVALDERPEVVAGCGRCVIARARAAHAESADLAFGCAAPPALLLLVRAETVARTERLLELLRRELLHVADMLDPSFGYAPSALADDGSARIRLARDRYRVAWDAYVDGRLTRLGRAPSGARAARLREFARAFPTLGAATETVFERFFEARQCTHAQLVAFATGADEAVPCRACPLCGLPAPSFAPAPAELGDDVLAAITRDFASWSLALGLCARCAELYQCRAAMEERR